MGLNDFKNMGPEYLNSFKKSYPQFLKIMRLIFSPSDKKVPLYAQSQFKFDSLDLLHYEMIKLIPFNSLSNSELLELWKVFSNKRANRFTDKFLIRYLNRVNAKDIPKDLIFNVLEKNTTRSEKVRIKFISIHFEKEIDELSKSKIQNQSLNNLIRKIQRLAPNASSFKDDFLETLAWKLKLSLNLVETYIEPLKSFNYKAIDHRSMQALSVASAIIKFLKKNESLDLIKHIQNPEKDLMEVITRWRKIINKISEKESVRSKQAQAFQVLDTFIFEATEVQKIVLIEALLGSKPHGLFYGGEQWQSKLYDLAGLEQEKEILLAKNYMKAIPKYEATIMLSYMIANNSDDELLVGGKSKLLKMAEMHGPVGIKGAQLAHILSIFGNDNDLHKAKDQADPSSMYEIYKTLKEELSPTEYSKIKSLKKLLGTGGIKNVVLVEFEDGKIVAASLKRPYLNERINDTLSVLSQFIQNLNDDPKYSDDVNFNHFLDNLKDQLAYETNFDLELTKSNLINKKYDKVPKFKGWKFSGVKLDSDNPKTSEILYFEPVTNSVPFKELSPSDKKIVSEYILQTELKFLFKDGIFDADRHLGNFLFEPQTKTIHAIDFAQVYDLGKRKILKSDSRRYLALIMAELSKGSEASAKVVSKSLKAIAENSSAVESLELEKSLNTVFKGNLNSKEKIYKILAIAREQKLHLPVDFTLGIMKGFIILANEDYAEVLGTEKVTNILRPYITYEVIKSKLIATKSNILSKFNCGNWLKSN